MKTIYGCTLILGMVASSSVFAGNLPSVSNTFSANTPASANEVNQNFEDVRAEVDDNANEIGANASAIGSLDARTSALEAAAPGTLVDSRFVITVKSLQAGPVLRTGYAWANNPSPTINTAYTPSSVYAYNEAGGAISITRTATGLYTVTFTGLDGVGGAGGGGTVTVNAYGSNDVTCNVVNWSYTGFTVNVRCFN